MTDTKDPLPIAEVVAEDRASTRREPKSFLRAPHGNAVTNGRPGPRVEVPPADEMSQPEMQMDAERPRHPGGPFKPGHKVAALGGRSKRGKIALGATLGITAEMAAAFPDDLRHAMRKGATYRRERSGELARLAGGVCGVGPSSMVASAGLALAASRYVFALAGLETDGDRKIKYFALFAKLTAESRQNELAAYELALREGKAAREGKGPTDPLAPHRGARPALPTPSDPSGANPTDGDDSQSTIDVVSESAER